MLFCYIPRLFQIICFNLVQLKVPKVGYLDVHMWLRHLLRTTSPNVPVFKNWLILFRIFNIFLKNKVNTSKLLWILDKRNWLIHLKFFKIFPSSYKHFSTLCSNFAQNWERWDQNHLNWTLYLTNIFFKIYLKHKPWVGLNLLSLFYSDWT